MAKLPENLTALRTDGTVAPLALLWRERPAVLFFLRHYG